MIYYFPSNRITVRVDKQPHGEFTAMPADNHDLGSPIGWGSTHMEAIADLADQLRERGELED
jgi:hypothetical protein